MTDFKKYCVYPILDDSVSMFGSKWHVSQPPRSQTNKKYHLPMFLFLLEHNQTKTVILHIFAVKVAHSKREIS